MRSARIPARAALQVKLELVASQVHASPAHVLPVQTPTCMRLVSPAAATTSGGTCSDRLIGGRTSVIVCPVDASCTRTWKGLPPLANPDGNAGSASGPTSPTSAATAVD